MAKRLPKRKSRGRYLTADEAAKYDTIRRQVEEEFADRVKHSEASPTVRAALAALKSAREARGLSLADVRDQTGIERSALSRLENGVSNVTVRTLERYAQAVGKRIVVQLEDVQDG
ncbi:MAG: helix-turn-helix transcriptional regulator [Acidobacteria bacterium]|nr:helix-turn-helix transcriptional regulator [Acidobacteriota bacterium]